VCALVQIHLVGVYYPLKPQFQTYTATFYILSKIKGTFFIKHFVLTEIIQDVIPTTMEVESCLRVESGG
jgi:hypothetical protein